MVSFNRLHISYSFQNLHAVEQNLPSSFYQLTKLDLIQHLYFFSAGVNSLVRVTDKETNQRKLIRDLQKDVKDLAFAYTKAEVILGAIDGNGTTYIYNIQRTKTEIEYPLLMYYRILCS